MQGTDTINYSNSSVIDIPLFSRPRPERGDAGAMASSLAAERSQGSLAAQASSHSGGSRLFSRSNQLPAATFLTHIPSLPRAVRVDCGQSSAKKFLTRTNSAERQQAHFRAKKAAMLSPYSSSHHLSSGESSSAVNLSSKSLKSMSALGKPLPPSIRSIR